MFNLGFGEIAVVLVVALIFLGPKMLPEIASGLGKIIREIRKATSDIRQDIELDDMIRKPLQELRDAATLPPEELKRRDAAKAALRKVEEEEASRKQREAKAAEEARLKQQETEAEANRQLRANEELAKAAAALPKAAAGPSDVVSAGGTMIANPPPSDDIRTLTPLPEVRSPAPVLTPQPPRLPPPPRPPLPPPRPGSPGAKAAPPADATIVDLQAQLKAAAAAQATRAGRATQPILLQKPTPEGKKD